MRASGPLSAALSAALIMCAGSVGLAQADPGTAPTPPPIEVSVACDASPERVTVRNDTRRPIVVQRVGSTWQQRAGEPYRVRKELKPGKVVAFTFGTGTGKGRRLSGSDTHRLHCGLGPGPDRRSQDQ